MDKGRNSQTHEIITAATAAAKHFDSVEGYQNRHGFECPDCGVQLTCINFDVHPLALNTKSMTHAFSARWNDEKNHKDTCKYRLSEPACLWGLINRKTHEHTEGEKVLRFYLPKPEIHRGLRSSSSLVNPAKPPEPRGPRGSMAQMMWAKEGHMLHAIHNRPRTEIITPEGRFPARTFVTPAHKLNTALHGSGVVFGAAKVVKSRTLTKYGKEFYIVNFATPSSSHGHVSANLWENVVNDNPLNHEILSNLQHQYYDVAIWWRDAAPSSYNGEPTLKLKDVGAFAIKDFS